jgi:uncharacterized protein
VNLSDDLDLALTVISALAVFIGIIGVVVPLVPGLVLTWAGVLVWCVFVSEGGWRWLILAVVTGLLLVGVTVKYLLPGRNLKSAGVPNLTLLAGGVLGIIGIFVIPLLGLPIGFVLGIWLAELLRMKEAGPAWTSTKHALKAVGLSIFIEFTTAVCIMAVWVIGALVTA